MRDVIEQGVGRLCEVNDLDVMEKALAMMVRAPTAMGWWSAPWSPRPTDMQSAKRPRP